MDEYDELFEAEDRFDEEYADDLEALAELENESHKPAKCPRLETDISDIQHLLDDQDITPNTNRQIQAAAVKRLFQTSPNQKEKLTSQLNDISPPSSPESYQGSHAFSSLPAALDISGLAAIQDSPSRPSTETQRSHHVLKRPPLEGEYIKVTDSSGNRVYLKQKEDTEIKITDSRILPDCYGNLGLLAVPIEVLRHQEVERRHEQLIEESQRLTEVLISSVDDVFEDSENKENEAPVDKDDQISRLWVDRFSPRHYTELLSDDFTNRCLLKWLKLWDTVVFGKERRSHPVRSDKQAAHQNLSKPNQGKMAQNRFKTKMELTEEQLDAELDQHKRPKFKVALLSGPPGLGKTTLAHVIAKHAGYNVVEINASDDRSAEVFQKRIDTATQMKSVLGANEKPNCLIIDEIDGAPAAAINILLSVLNRKDGHGGPADEETVKKKKKKESILLRPIICICNDLYVPALRPLRQQAFLLTFPPTQPSRLTQRLLEISLGQGLKVDTGTLMSLCEKTDNDIRSCINTLQFLHGRGHKKLDSKIIQSISIGQKDQNKGLFHLWQEIFQLPRAKRKRIGEGFEEHALSSGIGTQRFQHILHLASSSGEYEKVSQGLYDNFLSMRVRDPHMHNTCEALDWLTFSDMLNQMIHHTQNFSLMRYQPFLSVSFHFLFAHTYVPRINYPHSHHEASSRMLSCRNALTTMLADIPPCIRTRISLLNLTLDMLALLLEIICPKLRPVNPQLFSTREKEQMRELIDTMLAYNLSYRQDRTPEGQYIYVLEPRVEEAVRFPGLPPHRQLTYQAKQTISREMELEKMRRAEQMMLQRNPPTKEKTKKTAGPKQISNHQQRLENIVKQTSVEIRPEVDFFGRAVAPKPQKQQPSSDTGEKSAVLTLGTAVGNSDVWFRFNEGMSNAVRRNVYVRELL